jgi:RecB family exonuclease
MPSMLPANARFTVTQLCAYRRCPREYELRYVRCLPEAPSASDLPMRGGGLSPIERGLLVHRVLQIVGRAGADQLHNALRIATTGRSISEQQVGAMREMCIWYLTQPAYAKRVAAADKLRTEMPLLFPLDGALIEGKIDALAERESDVHLFDYKTGEEPKGETLGEHVFQVGLYALGVRRVLGRDPSSAAIVYLASRDLHALSLPGDLAAAAQSARDAIAGIAARDFAPRDSALCVHCGLAWACQST